MQPVSMALVGLGGFGVQYIRWFQEGEISQAEGFLAAIVDPYASASPAYDWVCQQGIPIYPTLEEMYETHTVELVLISSPTEFHKPQIFTALDHGSHVLCEKPLTTTGDEGLEIQSYAKKKRRSVGVGFQWSFSKTMQTVKQDILDGRFGKPLQMKSLLAWPRPKAYYTSSTWKGRIVSQKGAPILDSVVANATAHYLHNIFFLLGDSMDTALAPDTLEAELYRANAIESFDTAIMTGTFASGAKLYYSASHAVDGPQLSPMFEYTFEDGTIFFNTRTEDNLIYARFTDGTEICYGDPFTLTEVSKKVRDMIRHVRTGAPVACTVTTVLPHLRVSNALFSFGTIFDFPPELREITSERVSVKGLTAQLKDAYQKGLLPSEAGLSWSKPPALISMEGYTGYILPLEG